MPPSDHIIWKFLAVIIIFLGLALSKYLGYDSWDSWKDIKASLIETLGLVLLFLAKNLIPSSAPKP